MHIERNIYAGCSDVRAKFSLSTNFISHSWLTVTLRDV